MVLKPFLAASIIFVVGVADAQTAAINTVRPFPPSTTIPIVFTKGIDATHVHVNDSIDAKTTQEVKLTNGQVVPAGSPVIGHVVSVTPFVFDPTPYAKQKQSALEIQFDSIVDHGSWGAATPKSSDLDPLGTTTQVGGDLVTPSQTEVRSQDDDVVGYKRHGRIYAHLIAASGNSPDGCDASDTEQSMGIFSASACGLYGFPDTTFLRSGRSDPTSTLLLESRRRPMKIYSKTNALLEVTDGNPHMASR